MVEPSPSIVRYVESVVRAERAFDPAADEPEVARRIMVRLHDELGKLIGAAGLEVLSARALVLARRTHPTLAGITTGPGGALVGLDTDRERAGLGEGSLAIVAHFIALLVTLIGEDLTMRLLQDLWPANDDVEGEK